MAKRRRGKDIGGYWARKVGTSKSAPSEVDFVEFMRFFGYELWEGQIQMAKAAEDVYHRRIAVEWPVVCYPSGHAIGKSLTAAGYGVFCAWRARDIGGCDVLQMAPNMKLTSNQEFGEVKRFCRKLMSHTRVEISEDRILMGDSRIIPIAFDRRRHGENSIQGFHAPQGVVFFMNEAANLPSQVVRSAYSCASGSKGLIWLNGNPISATSNDALSFAFKRAHASAAINICSGDHPNVQQKRTIIEGAVSWEYVATVVDENAMLYEHDPDDGEFEDAIGLSKERGRFVGLVTRLTFDTRKFSRGDVILANEEACRRVFGTFVSIAAPNSILPVDFFGYNGGLDQFFSMVEASDISAMSFGLDVSRKGDDKGKLCALCVVDGIMHVAILDTFYKALTEEYVDRTIGRFQELYALGVTDMTLAVDGTGGYGAGVVDVISSVNRGIAHITSDASPATTWLSEMRQEGDYGLHVSVIDFQFSTAPTSKKDKRRYKTKASKHAKTLKNIASKYIAKCYNWDQDDIEGAINRKTLTHRDRFILQPKKIHKVNNGGKSPDGFDALLLSVISYVASPASYTGQEKDVPAPRAAKAVKPLRVGNQGPVKHSTFKHNSRRKAKRTVRRLA